MKSLLSVIFVSLFPIMLFAYSAVTEISRPARWVQVTDPKELIDQNTKAQINQILENHRIKTTEQIAVVVVDKIENTSPKEFAIKLFEAWQIGDKVKDNGLLILLSIDDHRVEFEVGYGLEGDLPDVTCKRIQTQTMVPEFKNGNYAAGLLEGVKTTIRVLENKEVLPADPVEKKQDTKIDAWWLLLGFYFLIDFIYIFIKLYSRSRMGQNLSAQEKYSYMVEEAFPRWSAFLFPLPALFIRVWEKLQMRKLRNVPQVCVKCNSPMRLLSTVDEIKHLTHAQKIEQQIASIHHDVWFCDKDSNVQIFHAKELGNQYETCSKCSAVAYFQESNEVITHATYLAAGAGVKTFKCLACNFIEKEKYTIPIETRSSSSDSGSSSSSSDSYSGGGSSGGGGAGSSW